MSDGGGVWREVFNKWLNDVGKSLPPAKQKAMARKIRAAQSAHRAQKKRKLFPR